MKNKKAVEMSLNTIVIAVIVLVVMAVILIVFSGLTKSPVKGISDVGKGLTFDVDCDGIKDAVDSCPCTKDIPNSCKPGDSRDGCPGKSSCTDTSCEKYLTDKNFKQPDCK